MKTLDIKLLVGIAVLAMVSVSILAGLGAFGSASKYVTFAEAKEIPGETVHVVGEWVLRERAKYDPNQDIFSFYLKDSTENVSLVHFHDPKPNNFETAENIVIEGKHRGEAFEADRILMKCPSKYNDGKFEIEEAEAT